MFLHRKVILAVTFGSTIVFPAWAYELGRVATPDEIKLWDIDVRPDGAGLPHGTAARGKEVYRDNCEVCHGANGEGGIKDRLVGGEGSLASTKPLKTVGSYWPYATTVFDYVRRAMPYPIPGSLTADDTYAVVAYILSLNGILPANGKLDQDNLPKIKMPNRGGFIPDAVFKIDNEPEAPAKPGAVR
jgi:S-disulfanyl-L-cysteine oxidoreductase SoxD